MNTDAFVRKYRWTVLACLGVLLAQVVAEWSMGRLWLGPDGRFGLWEWDIWSDEMSQRVMDPYIFSHVIHGFLFYALTWAFARRVPTRTRLLMAVMLESSWEVLENSPLIIDRYRAVTVSLGYVGDSILNSVCDVFWMSLGFVLAWRNRVWVTVAIALAFEVGTLLWVRDNLALNVIMLVVPIEAIKDWQSAGHV